MRVILLLAPWLLSAGGCGGGDEEPAFTISKETTFVTETLTADGLPDYCAAMDAIARGDIQPEENAYVLFAQALGPKHIGEQRAPRLFERLGVSLPADSPGPPKEYLIYLNENKIVTFQQDNGNAIGKKDRECRIAMERPWSAEEFPDVDAWLESNAACLDLIVEGSMRPRCYSPWVASAPEKEGDLYAAMPLHDMVLREAGRQLVTRGMRAIAAGDLDAAWRELIACQRLGRHVAASPSLVDALRGISIEDMALQGQIVLPWELQPDAAKLANMSAELDRLPPPAKLADKVGTGERMFLLTAVFRVMHEGHEALLPPKWPNVKREEEPDADLNAILPHTDWDAALRELNGWFDELEAAMRLPTWRQRDAALRDWKQRLSETCATEHTQRLKEQAHKFGKSSDLLAQYVARECMRKSIDILASQYAEDRSEQRMRNLRLAYALAAYRADRGEFPAALDELRPAYVSEIPPDLFAEAPPRYERTAEGYKLWSIGRDGRDDGGQADMFVPPSKNDDIGIVMPPPKPQPLPY